MAKDQEWEALRMRGTGRVTGRAKERPNGEYTEGTGARERLWPLECAIQAAVQLMRHLH